MADRITYNITEAAQLLGIATSNLRQIERTDPTFPSIRITPRRIIIPRDALHTWMAAKVHDRASGK